MARNSSNKSIHFHLNHVMTVMSLCRRWICWEPIHSSPASPVTSTSCTSASSIAGCSGQSNSIDVTSAAVAIVESDQLQKAWTMPLQSSNLARSPCLLFDILLALQCALHFITPTTANNKQMESCLSIAQLPNSTSCRSRALPCFFFKSSLVQQHSVVCKK